MNRHPTEQPNGQLLGEEEEEEDESRGKRSLILGMKAYFVVRYITCRLCVLVCTLPYELEWGRYT